MHLSEELKDTIFKYVESYIGTPHMIAVSGEVFHNPDLEIYNKVMANTLADLERSHSFEYVSSDVSLDDSIDELGKQDKEFEKLYGVSIRYVISVSHPLMHIVWVNVEKVGRFVIIDILEYCKLADKLPTDFLLKEF
jgi:hypothetical protein